MNHNTSHGTTDWESDNSLSDYSVRSSLTTWKNNDKQRVIRNRKQSEGWWKKFPCEIFCVKKKSFSLKPMRNILNNVVLSPSFVNLLFNLLKEILTPCHPWKVIFKIIFT